MKPGTVIAERYEILRFAASGGMSEVHLALDTVTKSRVALKLLLDAHPDDEARFDREIDALGQLSHRGIVGYLGHGTLSTGVRYLVMEWLEGEGLDQALLRGPLTVADTLVLIRGLVSALAVAHARGIVHRDLKPGNVVLVGGRVESPKILDFGIAKLGQRTRITGAGALLGTPAYMAPEQVRGDYDVDARADVFALGCLFYECLAGKSPFGGDHLHAVLAKVLFAEPRRLRDIRPEVPESVETLVLAMMMKETKARPADASVVLELLSLAEDAPVDSRGSYLPGAMPLSLEERRPVAALLIGRARGSLPPPNGSVFGGRAAELDRTLQADAEALGATCEVLPDGSLALWTAGALAATDLAERAARVALALHAKASHRPFALAVGWGALPSKGDISVSLGGSAHLHVHPLVDTIDRAARVLAPHGGALDDTTSPIFLDEVTAGLLDARFDIRENERGYSLHGERPALPSARTLLGKPTACVGRDRELRMLAELFDACVDEPCAEVVLVTAPAGVGKTRLAHEFVKDALSRVDGVSLWIAGSDILRAGSAFGFAARALCMAFGITAGDSPQARRDKISERVEKRVQSPEKQRVARFLGEVVGAPFPDQDDPKLRAARVDVQLMVDQIQRAFIEFVAAECEAAPVLLVLEDLQYGDLPTLRMIDAALRELPDKPLFVLALARPEISTKFPRIFKERRLQEVRLGELGKRPSERLVRLALGESVPQPLVDRIVMRSEGNAFYLEELIRAAVEGHHEELPETVVAMVQSRLGALSDEERRVLRAASVFGDVFWAGGARALVGKGDGARASRAKLEGLVEKELLSFRVESRFPGEQELVFRHALVREGAYAMLTEEDRALGHKLAGLWLERHGETDPLVLATHFAHGLEGSRAAHHYHRAADEAHRAGDDDEALRRAERGLSLGPDADTRVGLLGVMTEALLWRDKLDDAALWGAKLTRIAPPGSAPWVRGALAQFVYAVRLGHVEEAIGLLDAMIELDPAPEVLSTVSLALAMAIVLLVTEGRIDLVPPIQRRLDMLVEPNAEQDPLARAFWHLSYPRWEAWIQENPWQSLKRSLAALAAFTEAGSRRGQHLARVFIGMSEWMLGASEKACETLRSDMSLRDDFAIVASLRAAFFALALSDMGDLESARRVAAELVTLSHAKASDADEARGRWALSDVLRRSGEFALAEQQAKTALSLRGVAPLDRAAAEAVLAAAMLSQGRPEEALVWAESAYQRYESHQGFGYRGGFLRLLRVECLDGAGYRSAAREALWEAKARLDEVAATIPDLDMRRGFLEVVPENARVLSLWQDWA